MKRIPAYLAAAAVALFWAADGRAQNASDESIAAEGPYLRVPLSGRLPNSFVKLSADLPLSGFDSSDNLPKSFLHISEELKWPNSQKAAGFLPNSFVKISVSLPERMNTDNIGRYGLNQEVKISGQLPHSFLKISSQYPTSKEN